MRTIHFSDARGNLKTVIDQVVDDADVTLITRRDEWLSQSRAATYTASSS